MSDSDGGVSQTETWNHLDLRELRDERGFECWNCESPTTEKGECDVCGTEPHEGEGWRIECVECGATEYGDRGRNVEHDMLMHRMENCPDARFEVTPL
jgi:hypothetical protein